MGQALAQQDEDSSSQPDDQEEADDQQVGDETGPDTSGVSEGGQSEDLWHPLLMIVLQILHLTQRQENAIRFWDLVLMERREESLDIVQ